MYVVGEVGIEQELDLVVRLTSPLPCAPCCACAHACFPVASVRAQGVKHIGGPSDGAKTIDLAPGQLLHHDPDVAAVVVGFDRYINYYKIQYATLCIRENPGCAFIATNTDAVTHLTDAQEWAGNGSMVGAIKGSTKREPTVVGKPAAFMLDYIANKFGVRKDQMCMVGDRLDTDILFGKDGGLRTLLVLSGARRTRAHAHCPAHAADNSQPIRPAPPRPAPPRPAAGVTTEETLLAPANTITPDAYTGQLSDLLALQRQAVAA